MREKPEQTVSCTIVVREGAIEAALAGEPITVVVSPGSSAPPLRTFAPAVLRALQQATEPLPIGKLATAAGVSRDLARVALRELGPKFVRTEGTARATRYSFKRKRGRA